MKNCGVDVKQQSITHLYCNSIFVAKTGKH